MSSEQLEGATAEQYTRMMRILTRVKEYVLVGLASNLKARNEAIQVDNCTGFTYYQGGLDVCTDIKELIAGNDLTVWKPKEEESGMHR